MATVEELKKNRKIYRMAFTIAINKLNESLTLGKPSPELEGLFNALKSKAETLFKNDELLKAALLEDTNITEEHMLSVLDLEETTNRELQFNILKFKCQSILSASHVHQNAEKAVDKSFVNRKFQLPALELKQFDGKVENWIGFWGQFRKIHQDSSIDDDDKFQYLLKATEPGTSARELVESYPPSGENYHKAINDVRERFAKDEIIIQHYVRKLLELVLLQNNHRGSVDLRGLYDKLNTQLRALDSLGVTSDKYAAMLYPLIESCIPEDALRVWERTSRNKEQNELQQLMAFLKTEVECEEKVQLAKSNFNDSKSYGLQPVGACIVSTDKKQPYKKVNRPEFSSSVMAKKSLFCIWCEKTTHRSSECIRTKNMTLEQKKEYLKSKKACMICLKIGHYANNCRSYPKCLHCTKRHTFVMCPNIRNQSAEIALATNKTPDVTPSTSCCSKFTKQDEEIPKLNEINQGVYSSHKNFTTLLHTLFVNLSYKDKVVKVRALFDSGSQKSYISKRVAEKLQLVPVSNHSITHCLFGGVETSVEHHKLFKCNVQDLEGKFEFVISVLDKEKICGYLPKLSDPLVFRQLRDMNIILNDSYSDIFDIDLLIGADHSGFLFTGDVVQVNESLVAMGTKLGWVLQGSTLTSYVSTHTNHLTNTSTNMDITAQLWDLEAIGIKDPAETKRSEVLQREIMNFFCDTIRINEEGRYEVHLPWKEDVNLVSNKFLAMKRLQSTTKRLISTGNFDEYDLVFKEWLDLGIIERVEDDNTGHYLPHHAVIKESSLTTRVRPVFDASARDVNGSSLNSSLESGLNLLELIPKLLIDFRKHAVGITADIKKAFLQISLTAADRKYLQFLWWGNEERSQLVTYRHCRVVFGVTCSPFLLNATIRYHLDSENIIPAHLKATADKLKHSFYVDNCITSCTSNKDAAVFQEQSEKLMALAKMELRAWVTGPSVDETIISILGIMWNTKEDTLFVNFKHLDYNGERVTKRLILSLTHRIFDPIGYTAPVALIPKLLLKILHELKLGWDDDVPTEVNNKFLQWVNKLKCLQSLFIPRRLSQENINQCKLSIHCFSDASKVAYAAVVFLRSEYKTKVTVQLLSAKSRLSPSKKNSVISVPRLELLAATMGTRLYVQAKNALCLEHDTYFWTDSNVVLSWIKNEGNWGVFVKNRVKEIRSGSKINDWRHITGDLNPADLPSRGCHADVLLKSRWWEGPAWLKCAKEDWPNSNCQELSTLPQEEENEENSLLIASCRENFTDSLLYFSKYNLIRRMVAWIFRFYGNAKGSKVKEVDLEVEEIKRAETALFKVIQKEVFGEKKTYKDLATVIDSCGLIRVRTKLFSEEIPSSYRFPILLPGSHKIVEKLVRWKHNELFHAGTQTVLANLRENLWITGVRVLVKRISRECVICKRHRKLGKNVTPLIPLPTNRTDTGKPFEVSGVDLAGPLLLRNGDKVWIVLYTCAVYRAVHLELVNGLSTREFLLSFRRFIARRGRVSTIYSDNGTNFIGARNLFKRINWEEVKSYATIREINWILIPPGSPWWGGWYERMVRMVKELLRRVLGNASLSFIELETFLVECEAIINSRPLSYVVDDVDIPSQPITPALFLQPLACTEVVDLDHLDAKGFDLRLKYLQKLRDDLKMRFRKEYLSLLVLRGKDGHYMLRVGDIVLVETPDKRIYWPLGRIMRLHEGRDGVCRVATIKTATGVLIRSLKKIHLLEGAPHVK